jgi:serine/threonine protein kinase
MGAGSSWYNDERDLLDAFRDSGLAREPVLAIAGYANLHRLRQGGQGVVYSATQLSTKRRVAVKVLPHGSWTSPRQRERFVREIELLAAVQHPNVVRLYDGGVTDQDQPYYVMEYVDGVPLDEYLQAPGRTATDRSIRSVLNLFAQVCDAVGAAHQRGMIHRDLKPSNILVDRDGKPRVLDFGLGKSLGGGVVDGSSTAVSLTGEFMGTLAWAGPEQVEGVPAKIGPRTDVYSLGVVLFQMLTEQFPYEIHGGFGEIADRIRTADPPKPSALHKEIDDEVDTIVLKCLAKEPERRYENAADLGRDIRH